MPSSARDVGDYPQLAEYVFAEHFPTAEPHRTPISLRLGGEIWVITSAEPLRKLAGPLRKLAGPLRQLAEPLRKLAGPLRQLAEPLRKLAEPLHNVPVRFSDKCALQNELVITHNSLSACSPSVFPPQSRTGRRVPIFFLFLCALCASAVRYGQSPEGWACVLGRVV